MVQAAGCFLLFPPASSPELNPIAPVFAQLNVQLRTVAARMTETVVAAIGSGLAAVTPAQIRASYRHGGYPLPHLGTQPT